MKLIFLVLFAMAFNANAGDFNVVKYFQSWAVIKSDDGKDLIAVTLNNEGNFIGYRCFSSNKTCIHVLSAGTNCEDGGTYPILVNSDYSPMTMNTVCNITNANHELLLTQYDTIHEILKKGSNVGFAIPMQSGQFKVVRFSLLGSDEAMDYVEQKTQQVQTGEQYL